MTDCLDSLSESATFQLLSEEEVEEHGLQAVDGLQHGLQSVDGLQAVAIGNEGAGTAATILQCTHGPDGQIYIPGTQTV